MENRTVKGLLFNYHRFTHGDSVYSCRLKDFEALNNDEKDVQLYKLLMASTILIDDLTTEGYHVDSHFNSNTGIAEVDFLLSKWQQK